MYNIAFDSCSLLWIVFLLNSSFTSQDFQASKTLEFGARKTRKSFNNMNFFCDEVKFWCDVYGNDVVCPNFLNDEKVRGVVCYQTLDTYIRLEAQ